MIHSSTRKRLQEIVPALLAWHKNNRRSFIWRDLERSPYIVLVSEFMLQQTGTKQVEKHLPEFLRKFPTVRTLAAASQAEVVRAWHGLGYNRRAINLHRTAKAIGAMSKFPTTLDGLRTLPGVGLYTASAILAFAHNADTAVVDVNIERVLSRLWKPMPDIHSKLPIADIYELDDCILPQAQSASWHEALMDLGSTICTKNKPQCSQCPARQWCPSKRNMKISPTPGKSKEKKYFGEPRRIWRGRILKAVADAETVSAPILTATLRRKLKVKEASFVAFVLTVLTALTKEGFVIRTRKGAYRLAENK